jgi:hypothetical protein
MPDLTLKIWRGDESTGVEVIMVPARNIRNAMYYGILQSPVPTAKVVVAHQLLQDQMDHFDLPASKSCLIRLSSIVPESS